MILPQIITPPPPCRRLIQLGQLSPLKTHPLAQPSGPSSDALDSSVNRTNFMSVFIYFLDHSIRKRLFLGVKEGLLIIVLIKPSFPRIRFHVVFGTSGRLASLNILLLVAPGILRRFLLRHDQNEVSSLKDFAKILSL